MQNCTVYKCRLIYKRILKSENDSFGGSKNVHTSSQLINSETNQSIISTATNVCNLVRPKISLVVYIMHYSWLIPNNITLRLHKNTRKVGCNAVSESFITLRCAEMKSIRSKSSIDISQHWALTPAVCSITIPAGLSRICLFQLIMPTLDSHKVINPNHCVHFHTCQTSIPHLAYLFTLL